MATRQTEPTGPRPPLANAARVQVTVTHTTVPARKWANVFHILANGPIAPSVGDLNTYASAFETAYGNSWKAAISNAYSITACDVSMINGSGVKGSAVATIPCTSANTPLPPNCAVAVSWSTFAYYRGGKPRTYIGGVPMTAIITAGDSSISAAYAGTLHTSATAFRNAVNALQIAGVGTTLGFVQYFKNYTMLPTPVFYGFTAEKVHERLDSQRKRTGRETAFGTA